MAAVGKFTRQEAPPSQLLGNFGADHGGGRGNYQMVPIGDFRTWSVDIKSGLARAASADRGVAVIASDENSQSFKTLTFNGPGTFTFVIRAGGNGRAGHTAVVLEDENGAFLDDIQVSVKNVKPVRYNIVLLSDAVTPSSMVFSEAQATNVMDQVTTYYLNEANTNLVRNKTHSLAVKRNLSDKNGVLQLDELTDNKEKIIFKEIMNSGFGTSVDVVYVFTWQMEGAKFAPIITTGLSLDGRTERATLRTGPTLIYINSLGTQLTNQVQTAAHETGHHFGLGHGGQPPFFLMHEGGKAAIGGGRMKQDDIDRVNSSGT
jgi:hypothetical protein